MILMTSKGKSFEIDDEDFDLVSKYKWHVDTDGYLCSHSPMVNGRRKSIKLHRLILALESNQEVDHADRNRSNNKKSNLRICTRKQNSYNRSPIKNKKSCNYKGVFFNANGGRKGSVRSKPWQANITINNKNKTIGRFKTPEEAAIAYNIVARETYGDFAYLNEVDHVE